MPKVRGPLFSISARKSLGKVLTFQGRPGGAAVYPYKEPKVPLTDKQIWQREKIAYLVSWWQSLSLADKAVWEAKAKGQGQSGYSYFIRQQKNWMLDPSVVLWLPLWSETLKGDSFVSKDSYGHTCNVTGATWTSQGRLFSGNDTIIIPNHAAFNFGASTDFTLIARASTSLSSPQYLIFKGDLGPGLTNYTLRLSITPFTADAWLDDGTTLVSRAGTTNLVDGVLHLYTATFDRDGNLTLIVDGEVEGAPVSISGVGDIDNAEDLIISGRLSGGVKDYEWRGLISEVLIYNRL